MRDFTKKLFIAAAALALMCAALSGCGQKPLRLHIMANSDSAQDQAVKLAVRDAVIAYATEHSAEFSDYAGAQKFINENLHYIKELADSVLEERGFSYRAACETGVFSFPDRTYGQKRYPAGDYPALRVVLGSGEGQNWWCVIFPPLCIVNADELPDEPLEYRSAVADFFSSIIGGQQ